MNILIVVDKIGSAIDRLAQAVMQSNQHFNIQVFPVHPKRNEINTLAEVQKLMKWADLIDIHYWRSGEVLRTSFPSEFAEKPKIICHFNPYDLDKLKWPDIYQMTIVGNQSMANQLPYAHLINYGVDIRFWQYKEALTEEKIVNMTVGRIEGKKGVREVAQACHELGYKLLLVGKVSDDNYFRQIMMDFGESIDFRENVGDNEACEAYRQSRIHVCNSVDNFESGTLPILEAASCGIPILTRNVGHVSDFNNGSNLVVRQGQPGDLEDLKKNLKDMMENDSWLNRQRESAWETVKNWYHKKMARQFSSLYYHLLGNKKPLVSVIIPTFDRGDALIEVIAGAVVQDWDNIEIIVADSGDQPAEPIIRKFRENTNRPIKYFLFKNKGEYTLAKARNLAVIEAEGEFVVFCDDRIKMDKDAVSKFMATIINRRWVWGVKDGAAKPFVENFSCVRRDDLINGGMFCERMDRYGGITQETRTRFESQGIELYLEPDVKANSVAKSGSKYQKRMDKAMSKFTLWKMYGGSV